MFDKSEYWLELCDDDLKTAKVLFNGKQFLWMGFVCHLIAEKALKAVIAKQTNDEPLKIHRLSRLAEIADIYDKLSNDQKELLDKLMPLQIEGRYPEAKQKIFAGLTKSYCMQLLEETEEFVCWIKQWLEKLPENTQTE